MYPAGDVRWRHLAPPLPGDPRRPERGGVQPVRGPGGGLPRGPGGRQPGGGGLKRRGAGAAADHRHSG